MLNLYVVGQQASGGEFRNQKLLTVISHNVKKSLYW